MNHLRAWRLNNYIHKFYVFPFPITSYKTDNTIAGICVLSFLNNTRLEDAAKGGEVVREMAGSYQHAREHLEVKDDF
jgi:hypothetical protein